MLVLGESMMNLDSLLSQVCIMFHIFGKLNAYSWLIVALVFFLQPRMRVQNQDILLRMKIQARN